MYILIHSYISLFLRNPAPQLPVCKDDYHVDIKFRTLTKCLRSD